MFEIIFLVSLSFYFAELVIFAIGARKVYYKINKGELPSISIIVAARNEEDNIIPCLEALDKLEYPEDKIEIILVNDNSTDNTEKLIAEFIEGKSKFKLIVPEKQIGHLKGKTNALANGVKIAKGEVILTTDADCIVSPTWAETIARYYDADTGFVGGITTQLDNTIFQGIQAIDFVYLLTIASGAQNLGKPLSCIGNNMSYRKQAYLDVGGYEGIPFSITEDFNLLRAIDRLNKYKIKYPLDPGALVVSKPLPDWRSIYWQKKRWGVGGMESDLIGYLVFVFGYLTHASILLSPFFFTPNVLYLILFKVITDYFFISPVYKKLKLRLKISHFLAFEIYLTLYVVLLPLMVLPNRKIKWKGRTY
ncbi:glycosyltransferase [Melioribacter sp. OK-6-Me]|uniref:glycosyltransferase n=1 Tax=unclassified Melioribacter TaxID=2627329 RepID=UPI003EDA266B